MLQLSLWDVLIIWVSCSHEVHVSEDQTDHGYRFDE